MSKLQRPATLKEVVVHSLLGWREPAPTLVDHDDEEPTALLPRPNRAPLSCTSRASLDSIVFDLRTAPRAPCASDPEIPRDTEPAPPPVHVAPPRRRQTRAPSVARTSAGARAPSLTRTSSVAQPLELTSSSMLRAILLALVVLAALASAGARQAVDVGPEGARALPHMR